MAINIVKTGSEVLAYCTACKMDLAAVVVAMDDAKVLRVQCKTCKKERAFKAPKGATTPGAAAPKKRTKKGAENAKPTAVAIEAEWKSLLEQAITKKARRVKYTPKETLIVGDVLDHGSFGEGIVMKLIHPNKAEVIFKNDMKVMMHSLGRR